MFSDRIPFLIRLDCVGVGGEWFVNSSVDDGSEAELRVGLG